MCISSYKPKVSVAVLTFNHGKYLEQCIQSILAQETDFSFEIIIADDFSSDRTRDIIRNYACAYPSIKPVFQSLRTGGPRNVCDMFSACSGEYVALCDGDDYFTDPCKLQIQADFLDENLDCAVCFHPVMVLRDGCLKPIRFFPDENILPRGIKERYFLTDLIRGNFIQTNSVMYRWRFSDGLPEWFEASILPGDWYWHLLHAEKGEIGFINRIMSAYRRHGDALFILAETDQTGQRKKFGLSEIAGYDVIDKHFKGVFRKILMDMAMGIIIDILQGGDTDVVNQLAEKFPHFVKYTIDSINEV